MLWSTTHDFNQFQSEYSTTEATRDSVIQRRTSGGTQEFSWNSWDHRDVLQVGNDCRVGIYPDTYAHANAFHLLSDGDIVVSLRGCAQVLRIDGSTGAVEWKLGGTAPPEDSDTEHLEIVGDSAGEFCGQHHVTLTSSNTIVMYDNGEAARERPRSRAVYNIASGVFRLTGCQDYPYTGGVHQPLADQLGFGIRHRIGSGERDDHKRSRTRDGHRAPAPAPEHLRERR